MTGVLVWLAVGVPVALLMEPWSRFVHGRLWHGIMWRLHLSHHVVPRQGFEVNDLLALSHAPVAIALIVWGCETTPGFWADAAFGAGLGMTAFGAAYQIFHEGVAHERIPVAFLRRWRFVEAIRKAHMVHHHTDGPPYGLFLGPREIAEFKASGRVLGPEGRRPEVVSREEARAAKRAEEAASGAP